MTTSPAIAKGAQPYTPLGAAAELFYSHDREVLIEGPAGTGKTRAILEKCHLLCEEVPGLRVLWLRATRASVSESVLATFENKVLVVDSYLTKGAKRPQRRSYDYRNGAQIVIGGLDQVSRIMSSEYDIICVFEATEVHLDSWETLLTRGRNNALPWQQQIADCNPAGPQHWLIKRAGTEDMRHLASRFKDNPSLTPEYLETLATKLSGHRRARLYDGLWVGASGAVYPDIDSCFVEHFDPPPGRLVGGIDFGWTNPFAALGGTVYIDDDRAILYIWYERYRSHCLIAAHAKALPTGHVWFADPSEPASIAEIHRAGHSIHKAYNDILVGVNAVTRRIDTKTLLISKRCTALRAEVEAYRYKEDSDSEKPIDESNHACDALRYLVMGIDQGRVAV